MTIGHKDIARPQNNDNNRCILARKWLSSKKKNRKGDKKVVK